MRANRLRCGLLLVLCGWPVEGFAQVERRSLAPLEVPPQPPAPQPPAQDFGQPQDRGSGYWDDGQPPAGQTRGGQSGPGQAPYDGQQYDGQFHGDPGGPTPLTPPGAAGTGYQSEPGYGGPAPGQDFSAPASQGGPDYGGQGEQFGTYSDAPAAAYGGDGETMSPMPAGVWRGVDGAELRRLLEGAKLPSASPILANLIARALAADPPQGGPDTAMRVAALSRAGRAEEIVQLLTPAARSGDPGISARYGLALLAAGREQEACSLGLGDVPASADRGSEATQAALLIPTYCAALRGDGQGAREALGAAETRGVTSPVAAAVIDSLAQGEQAQPPVPGSLDVLDYAFLRLGKVALPASLAASANPTLLYLIAQDKKASPDLRVAAAERGASLHIVDGTVLREAYEQAAPQLDQEASAPHALRARLFATLEKASSAAYRAESIDALLASGKQAGIHFALAEALAPQNAKLAQADSGARFAETGVRVAILAGDEESAWAWIERGGQAARSWPLLVAVSAPTNQRAGEALNSGAAIASQTGLPGPVLHRLIAILDALDHDVPIPLWDMANQSEQPSDGYLPERGVLTDLKQASEAGEVGKTVLLAAAALGPEGPSGANLIALGDVVRALRKVGLEAEARRLGFEALYPRWPFQGST